MRQIWMLIKHTVKSLKTMNDLPILFIIFNRSEIAFKAFQQIKSFKPKNLFIASDGPRPERDGEDEIVNRIRSLIISEIDWDCNLHTLFQESNLGCGKGVYTAINWFFSHVEYGVILEDDCIANKSFFQYAYEMLIKYKNDNRIGMIAGHNAYNLQKYPYSIIYSRFKACWGWGTWSRAWNNMDFSMDWRDSCFKESILKNSGYHAKDLDKWKFELKCIDKKYVSAWDWQWYFSLAAQNQLCIFPAVNLISNIGNDASATHTSFSNVTIPNKELSFPLSLPPFVCPYDPFDNIIYKQDHSLKSILIRIIPVHIKNIIKKY